MHIHTDGRDTRIEAKGFSLSDTLNCGQCFRWRTLPDGSFSGVSRSHALRVRQEGEWLRFFDTSPEEVRDVWIPYFDLDTDYAAMNRLFRTDPTLRAACDACGGIRILRQDPWEALCSFILSQNNNIPRIQGIVTRLCEAFGSPLGGALYTFPTAQRLAVLSVEDLSVIRAGFRAKYVLDAAKKVAAEMVPLDALYSVPLADAQASLMQINGVGPKVADCALLFGLHRLDAFPQDVWIKRVLAQYYPDGFPVQLTPWRGVAQQYLFHYVRTGQNSTQKSDRPSA